MKARQVLRRIAEGPDEIRNFHQLLLEDNFCAFCRMVKERKDALEHRLLLADLSDMVSAAKIQGEALTLKWMLDEVVSLAREEHDSE
jgi:hypothetical protein